MSKYHLTNAAAKDLRSIIEYTYKEWGPEQVIIYKEQLKTRFGLLAKNPLLGRAHLRLPEHIYYVLEGKHYIFYKSVDDGIEIIRILHTRMDVIRHLSGKL